MRDVNALEIVDEQESDYLEDGRSFAVVSAKGQTLDGEYGSHAGDRNDGDDVVELKMALPRFGFC